VEARVLRVPPAVVSGAGAVGSVLQRLGWRRLALTADKTRELLARHWSARTVESMHALGVDDVMPFGEGAATAWTWYRDRGWLR
jgi:hypothetical protein